MFFKVMFNESEAQFHDQTLTLLIKLETIYYQINRST